MSPKSLVIFTRKGIAPLEPKSDSELPPPNIEPMSDDLLG